MMKRFETRRTVARPIEVISSIWDEPLEFYTGDLSPRGTYVYSELMPDAGEHVVCSFDLGKELRFDFFGEVVRVNMLRRTSDRDLYPGFGVRFLDASPLDRLRIRNVLAKGAPPRPTMRPIPSVGRRKDPALGAIPGLGSGGR